jgi:hypothetical protein
MTPPTTPTTDDDLTLASNDFLRPQGFQVPDDKTAVWPTPHDPKLDTIEILRAVFAELGLDDIAISKDGAFTAAQLVNEAGASVPYVTVTRSGDVGVRRGLSNLVSVLGAGDPLLVDPTGVVPAGGATAIYGEWSNTTLDITIADKNGHRADQVYIIVKLLMQAVRKEYTRIGYVDVKRLNGVDGASIEIDSPSPYLVFTRTLTYALDYPDYIASVDTLIHLVKQTLDVNPASPDARITTTI